jgi:hypothetical protein
LLKVKNLSNYLTKKNDCGLKEGRGYFSHF